MPSPRFVPRPPSELFAPDMEHARAAETLVEAVAATAEICGQLLSPAAVRLLADDLSGLGQEAVLAALARCRMEVRGRLKVSDILARLEDGRPDAGIAWRMLPRDERETVVWTEEVAEAWGLALPLLSEADVAAARATFEQAYHKAVLLARAQHVPVRWVPSLGSDMASREQVLREAVRKGLLTAEHVAQLLLEASAERIAQTIAQTIPERVPDPGSGHQAEERERFNLH